MSYALCIDPSCKKEIKRITKKNPQLQSILEKKVTEILENPTYYKPLRNDLAGYYRAHVMTRFVLIFAVNVEERIVLLVHFSHHDDAYQN